MENILDQTLGSIVAKDYSTASVFNKHEIDFCCNGNRTLAEACEQKKIDSSTVVSSIEEILNLSTKTNNDYRSWPPDLLIDYIIKIHHSYVEAKGPEILEYVNKIAQVHGSAHPELIEIKDIFHNAIQELAAHMKKEELVLFPFIKKMATAEKRNKAIETPHFGSIQNPINMMHEEHDHAGELFKRINMLSKGYTVPSDACNTYLVCYKLLNDFEQDLHLHIHLENNILFPKALKLYNELLP